MVTYCYKFVLEFGRKFTSTFQEILIKELLELQMKTNSSFLVKNQTFSFAYQFRCYSCHWKCTYEKMLLSKFHRKIHCHEGRISFWNWSCWSRVQAVGVIGALKTEYLGKANTQVEPDTKQLGVIWILEGDLLSMVNVWPNLSSYLIQYTPIVCSMYDL